MLGPKGHNVIEIKFRLPHGTGQFKFLKEDKVGKVFRYVHSVLRDFFDHKYSEFDLTQAFPQLSLREKQEKSLS